VERFKNYPAKEAKTKSDTNLSINSQSSYFFKLKATLNQAVENGIISHNPAICVKPARQKIHTENTSP
jgi:hypothetical protein